MIFLINWAGGAAADRELELTIALREKYKAALDFGQLQRDFNQRAQDLVDCAELIQLSCRVQKPLQALEIGSWFPDGFQVRHDPVCLRRNRGRFAEPQNWAV